MNRYPLWKNLLIIVIIFLGFLYALPNIYGESPAIQISGLRGKEADVATLESVEKNLATQKIEYSSMKLENGVILVQFDNEGTQIKAKKVIDDLLVGKYSVALNLIPNTPKWLSSLGGDPMKLGLDLRGGVHFLMEVDGNYLINKNLQEYANNVPTRLRTNNVTFQSLALGTEQDITMLFATKAEMISAESNIHKLYPEFKTTQLPANTLKLTFTEAKIKEDLDNVINQSLLVLRNRVTEIGVAEPIIQRQGANKVVVELPGIQDTARAKEIIGATATLSFHFLNSSVTTLQIDSNFIPANTVILTNNDGRKFPILRKEILSGKHIIDASGARDEYGRPQVVIQLDSSGATILSDATKSAIGKPMATIYSEYKDTGKKTKDGKSILRKTNEVSNVATIQARLGANFVITGLDSMNEANNLALILRSGSLSVPIQIVQERTIGPSLGAENIKQGLITSIVSLILVMIFMSIVYRVFGIISALVLIFNLVLTIAVLSVLPGTTLTLPGIAGLVLTVGMSVDANVLIFERIRETLRLGKTAQQALSEGYEGAWTSIFDANLTTILTAGILYLFGTGPIKGFAITLSVGVAISMFTAIVGSKMFFNWIYGINKSKNLHV